MYTLTLWVKDKRGVWYMPLWIKPVQCPRYMVKDTAQAMLDDDRFINGYKRRVEILEVSQ